MDLSLRTADKRTVIGMASSNFPLEEKFKVTPSAGKVMATIFWDTEGMILVGIVSCGQTINSNLYIQTLENFAEASRRV
jgi:hypothetical protein